MSLPPNRAMTHFATHAGITKNVREKWEELSSEKRAFWEDIAFHEAHIGADVFNAAIRRYNAIWESAPGITAENVEDIRRIAVIYALHAVIKA